MGIGQNIRNLRTDAGMSQEELAERLDPPYTRPAVTAWESGRAKPHMDTVVQIAELFGVSVADLMGHGGVEPRRSSRRVPVRLMGSAHAGEWSEAVPDGVVAVIPEEVADRHPGSYLLRVEGTCMDNAYPEGCMVLVDPTLEPWASSPIVDMPPTTFDHRWRAALEDMGLRPIPPKLLRHTSTTIMETAGVAHDLADKMHGRSDHGVAYRNYYRPDAALMEEAAGRVGELLDPSPRTSPDDAGRRGDVPAGGEGRGTPPGVG